MFTNRGNAKCFAEPTWELDFGGSVQGQKSCIASFMPNIKHYYIKVDKMRFPCMAGLDQPFPSEIKQIEEQVSETHVDKVSI